MKKKFYLVGMLAAGLTFAGCTDDIDDASGSGIVEGATGYVKVAVNLPTTSGNSTRGVNDNFDDGLADEYKVNSGIIAFFAGASESEATLVKAYTMSTGGWSISGDAYDQITTKSVVIQEAPIPADGNDLYALVILNPNNVVSVSSAGGLTINGSTMDAGGLATISNLQNFLQGQSIDSYTKKNDEASFLMTNAPLAIGLSSSFESTILTPVTVYTNKTQAEGAKNPDQIYVERAVAKVTLKGFTHDDGTYTKDVKTDAGSVFSGDKVTLTGWTLNMTNKSTALVRNVSDFNTTWKDITTSGGSPYFYGSNKITTGPDRYRIYWAKDMNYASTDTESDGFNNYTSETDDTSIVWNKDTDDDTQNSHPLYCLENTMDVTVAKQTPAPITYVLLKTKYDFNGEDADADFFMLQNDPSKGTMTQTDFLEEVNTLCGYTSDGDKLTIPTDLTSVKGGLIDTEEEVAALFGLSTTSDGEKIKTVLSKVGPIKYYKEGVAYYYASYIKHFGDDYAVDPRDPNKNADETTGLGYYGVVRNNWYELNISSISGPGEPEITPPTDNYGYINAQINILSWAKREQNVDL